MPTRILRDGILNSERVNQLSERAELFYRRLMSVVDDYGRYPASLPLLRSYCYPLKVDVVKEDSIKKHLAEAEAAGLIVLYTVAGKTYLEMQDFGQRIQSKSKYPDPLSGSTVNHGEPPESTVNNGLVVVVVEDGVEVGQPRKRGKQSKASMPEGFEISDRVKRWAETKGFVNLDAHFEHFKSKALSLGYAYADWDEAFMGAVRDDWAKLRTVKAGEPKPRSRPML